MLTSRVTAFSADAGIASTGDFHVGGTDDGGDFTGEVDFPRIGRGSFADARTSIDEPYAWQFDGPMLRDIAGNPIYGARRDAGALELDRR